MAEVIKEVAENAVEEGKEVLVNEAIIDGPTIFKTSNTAKITFGVVVGIAVAYGIYKGARHVINKKKANLVVNEANDIPDDAEEADFMEVDDLD